MLKRIRGEQTKNISDLVLNKSDSITKENEQLPKRLKHNPVYKFKCKSNQVQYDFDFSIIDQLQAFIKPVKRGSRKRLIKSLTSITKEVES